MTLNFGESTDSFTQAGTVLSTAPSSQVEYALALCKLKNHTLVTSLDVGRDIKEWFKQQYGGQQHVRYFTLALNSLEAPIGAFFYKLRGKKTVHSFGCYVTPAYRGLGIARDMYASTMDDLGRTNLVAYSVTEAGAALLASLNRTYKVRDTSAISLISAKSKLQSRPRTE
jgi:predicted GNAT family acetyltransferase